MSEGIPMPEEAVLFSVAGAVATITLNRPQALNALDRDMALALRDALGRAEVDPAIRCVIVTGAGDHFMAGGDIRTFAGMVAEGKAAGKTVDQEAFARMVGEVHDCVEILRRMPKPVVAAVRGAAAGFGVSLMLACDLAVAADDTVLTLAYCHIGVSPDGGATWHLPRVVGLRKAMEIALLGDRFDAATAERLGLVNRIVPAADLAGEAAALAARLANGPTLAYARTKALLNASADRTLADQLTAEASAFATSAATEDFAEGVTAFVEKRKPTFRGA